MSAGTLSVKAFVLANTTFTDEEWDTLIDGEFDESGNLVTPGAKQREVSIKIGQLGESWIWPNHEVTYSPRHHLGTGVFVDFDVPANIRAELSAGFMIPLVAKGMGLDAVVLPEQNEPEEFYKARLNLATLLAVRGELQVEFPELDAQAIAAKLEAELMRRALRIEVRAILGPQADVYMTDEMCSTNRAQVDAAALEYMAQTNWTGGFA